MIQHRAPRERPPRERAARARCDGRRAPATCAPDGCAAATPDVAPRRQSATPSHRGRRRAAPRTSRLQRLRAKARATLISVVTVVALFALWWLATHFGWMPRRSSCRRREDRVHSFGDAWRPASIQGGKPLAEHFGWQPVPRVRGLPAGLRHGDSDRHRDGRVAHRARHLRSADRVLPAAAAARLPAADRHLVRHRRDREDRADLPRLLRAARDGGARRRAQRDASSRSTPRTRWARRSGR